MTLPSACARRGRGRARAAAPRRAASDALMLLASRSRAPALDVRRTRSLPARSTKRSFFAAPGAPSTTESTWSRRASGRRARGGARAAADGARGEPRPAPRPPSLDHSPLDSARVWTRDRLSERPRTRAAPPGARASKRRRIALRRPRPRRVAPRRRRVHERRCDGLGRKRDLPSDSEMRPERFDGAVPRAVERPTNAGDSSETRPRRRRSSGPFEGRLGRARSLGPARADARRSRP